MGKVATVGSASSTGPAVTPKKKLAIANDEEDEDDEDDEDDYTDEEDILIQSNSDDEDFDPHDDGAASDITKMIANVQMV
jgi:hypothetical protein